MDFFKNIFTRKFKPDQILDIVEVDNDKSINVFKKNINYILNDLILPIIDKNFKTHNYKTLSLLSNPSNCNKLTLFLRDKISQNFNSIELSNLADEIFFSKNVKSDCKTDKCEILDKEKYKIRDNIYTKRQLCKLISKHYIKQLNLIAAVISAVNPERNFCLLRLKKLLKVMTENNNKGLVEICKKDIVYDGKLTNQDGFKELLNLYYFHLLEIFNKEKDLTQEEITKIQVEYQKFVTLFSELIINKNIRKQEVINDMMQDKIKEEENMILEKELKEDQKRLEKEQAKEQKKLEEELKKEQQRLKKEQKKLREEKDGKKEEENNEEENNEEENNEEEKDKNNEEEKDENNEEEKDENNEEEKDENNEEKNNEEENNEEENNEEENNEEKNNEEENNEEDNNEEENNEEEKEKKRREKEKKRKEKEDKNTEKLLNNRLDQNNSLNDENQGIGTKFNNIDQKLNTNINKIDTSLKEKKNQNKKRRRRKKKNIYDIKLNGGAKNKSVKNRKSKKPRKKNTKKNKDLFKLKKNYFDGEKFENKYFSRYDNPKKLNLEKTTKLFLDFIKNNNTIKKYNPSIIPMINSSFRSYNRSKLEELCDYSKDNVIKINLNSKLLKDYITNYDLLKKEYIDVSAELLNVLENNLLTFELNEEKNKEIFKLKNISTDELSEIESFIRDKISNLYFTCQFKYLTGIQELDEYFLRRDKMEMK